MDVKTAYEQWLHDFAADADTIADLKAIANDPAEIEDRFYTELSFGTAGMRGVLGAGMNRMNRYNVRRATKGLAKYLLQNPQEAQRGVVIAYDSRRFSAEFARDAALVLAQEGVPAYLFDALRPVPILSYAVRHLHAIAGIVITASHNPPQYNGYKVYAEDGAQVHEDYFAGSLANMEDDYGFVFFPKGPRAETYLYAPSDNIMVIPACYDADRAWKIAFAYNLFTNPTPGYTDSDDWKNGYYQKYRDERAVDETITMMREPEHQFVWYSDMVTGYDLGSQYIWDVYAQATTPAEKAESMRGTWQAYIDEANAN